MSTELPVVQTSIVIGRLNGQPVIVDAMFLRNFLEPLITRAGGQVALSNLELASEATNLGDQITALTATVNGIAAEVDQVAGAPLPMPTSSPDDPDGRMATLEAMVYALQSDVDALKGGTVL